MFDLNYHNELNRLLTKMTSEIGITYSSNICEQQRRKKEEIFTYKEKINRNDLSNQMMEDERLYGLYFLTIIKYFNLQDKFDKYCSVRTFNKYTARG